MLKLLYTLNNTTKWIFITSLIINFIIFRSMLSEATIANEHRINNNYIIINYSNLKIFFYNTFISPWLFIPMETTSSLLFSNCSKNDHYSFFDNSETIPLAEVFIQISSFFLCFYALSLLEHVQQHYQHHDFHIENNKYLQRHQSSHSSFIKYLLSSLVATNLVHDILFSWIFGNPSQTSFYLSDFNEEITFGWFVYLIPLLMHSIYRSSLSSSSQITSSILYIHIPSFEFILSDSNELHLFPSSISSQINSQDSKISIIDVDPNHKEESSQFSIYCEPKTILYFIFSVCLFSVKRVYWCLSAWIIGILMISYSEWIENQPLSFNCGHAEGHGGTMLLPLFHEEQSLSTSLSNEQSHEMFHHSIIDLQKNTKRDDNMEESTLAVDSSTTACPGFSDCSIPSFHKFKFYSSFKSMTFKKSSCRNNFIFISMFNQEKLKNVLFFSTYMMFLLSYQEQIHFMVNPSSSSSSFLFKTNI